MLPNFTIVICGAILTVMMLAVTGSGLITPETRTRIGEMPEVGRPMMQRMISEPAGQAQFAALELSRRAQEIVRLRDLVPALVSWPAHAGGDGDPVQEPATEPAPASVAADHPDEPTALVAPAVAAAPVPGPVVVAAVAPAPPPAAPPPAVQAQDSGKTVADPLPADRVETSAGVDAIEAMIPGPGATVSQAVAALADTAEVAPSVHLGARLNVRLPRARTVAKAATWSRRPVRHAVRRPHRHVHRFYAVHGGPSNPFGQPGIRYR
jgi:hypothetical protein